MAYTRVKNQEDQQVISKKGEEVVIGRDPEYKALTIEPKKK